LGSALSSLCDRLEQAGDITVQRTIDRQLPRLSPEAELVIYRIAQESMTNTLRHGNAQTIRLDLRYTDDRVWLTVDDDGAGFDMAATRQFGGIRGMRERAVLIGARLEVESEPERGTHVSLAIDAEEAQR
jgi:two-component system sensor histidine kinase UhpB